MFYQMHARARARTHTHTHKAQKLKPNGTIKMNDI